MSFNNTTELIIETLYFRRMVQDTCLQVNLAGQELEQQSADILPAIEHIIRTVVIPELTHVRRYLLPGSDDCWYEADPFPGLTSLLGAYLIVGSKHNVGRMIDFLRTLPPVLQASAIALIPVRFKKLAGFRPQETIVNELKEKPDFQLISFVRELSHSDHQILRDNAIWVQSFFPP